MSAISPASPWRGPLVDAAVADFPSLCRRAAAFLYAFGEETVPDGTEFHSIVGTITSVNGVGVTSGGFSLTIAKTGPNAISISGGFGFGISGTGLCGSIGPG